jgi:hypothetical protein
MRQSEIKPTSVNSHTEWSSAVIMPGRFLDRSNLFNELTMNWKMIHSACRQRNTTARTLVGVSRKLSSIAPPCRKYQKGEGRAFSPWGGGGRRQ